MADESGEIILETQDDSEANSVFEGGYGRYLTGSALVRKTEQRNRKQNGATGMKIEIQVQEISQRFKESCTRVIAQATQLENELKLHEDKLTVKINALVEGGGGLVEFSQKENSLDSKQRNGSRKHKEALISDWTKH